MPRGFDIIRGIPKNHKRNKPKITKRNKKSNSFLSWILLVAVTIIVGSLLTSNNNAISNKPPQSSINTEVLAESIEENQKETAPQPQVSSNSEAPDNPTNNLKNASSENSNNQEIDDDFNQENNSAKALNKLELKIKVLNGSGETNQAANTKEKLEKLGYIIAKIGNAKNIYNTTIIYFHNDQEKTAQQLSKDLAVQTKIELNNQLTINYDLLVVIGKNAIE